MSVAMTKEVILTGIRANNDLTLGNYFGAILPIIDMATKHADEHTVILFVADLHSFITPVEHDKLQEQIMHTVRTFSAAGLPMNHPNVHMFRQSYVPAHSELTWILDCFTGFGEMSRMIQFKEKSAKMGEDRNSVGIFNYPVLMASDILLYGAEYVPVGEDQTQHLEYTRDIAERMNNQFGGEILKVPKAVKAQHKFFGNDQGLRIKDLQDPTKKMSKSDETGNGVIFLGDQPEVAAKKIMGATTDSIGVINFDWEKQPGITNLLQLLALATERPQANVNKQWEGVTAYGDLKKAVAAAVTGFLQGLQAQLDKVDDVALLKKLIQSESAMNTAANRTLHKVQKAVGLR
jgi:tryptophanyl-tRNA synthetase